MHFQKFSFALLLLLGMAFTGRAETPNVLFLAVDDMNDWLGCLETTPHAITPNIDQLAARGVNFTNAHHLYEQRQIFHPDRWQKDDILGLGSFQKRLQ